MTSNAFPVAEQTDRPSASPGLGTCLQNVFILVSVIILLGTAFMASHRDRIIASHLPTCQNNLKLLSLTILADEALHGRFPLASSQPFTGQPGTYQSPHPAGYGWQVAIMPHLELHEEYDQWKVASQNFDLPPFDPANNQELPTRSISVLTCPADPTEQLDFRHSEYQLLGSSRLPPARSSYVAFAASHFTNDTGPGQLYESDPQSIFDGNGVLPFPKAPANIYAGIRMSDISDGASRTLMLCETRETAYAAWCDGQATWIVGAWPGNKNVPQADGGPDGMLGWPETDRESWIAIPPAWKSDTAETYLPASRYHAQYERRWGPSSHHRHRVVHAFADGSVVTINPNIDRNLYLRLISRDGSEKINQPSWAKSIR